MNTFITPTWVTKDVAMNWKNNIKLVSQFDRQWNNEWENKPKGAQIGDTVQVRIPQRFVVNEGQALIQQAILNQTVPITINHQYQVGMGWSSADTALRVEEVQKRYTKPAGIALANKADVQAGAEVYKSVYYSIGAPGQGLLGQNQTWTDGVALMRAVGVPEELYAVTDPLTQSKLTNANIAQFNPAASISKIWKTSQFGEGALGVDEWSWDPNMPTHTTGSFTSSTPAVSGANQTGSTLAISGMGTYAFKAGDVFTIDGVYAVNPQSYVNSGFLQQFVITADLSGSSTGTLSIAPAIITSGQLQTVTNSPAGSAAISFLGSTGTVNATMTATASKQSLLFNPSAFAIVFVDLPQNLAGANAKRFNDAEAQISLRWVEQYNIQTDQAPSRMDMLVGVAPILPYFAIRAWS